MNWASAEKSAVTGRMEVKSICYECAEVLSPDDWIFISSPHGSSMFILEPQNSSTNLEWNDAGEESSYLYTLFDMNVFFNKMDSQTDASVKANSLKKPILLCTKDDVWLRLALPDPKPGTCRGCRSRL